jgi:hypothetical protein
MNLNDWLAIGREHGFCSAIVCDTHDGAPRTPEELDAWEEGDDPCCSVVRIYTDDKTREAIERNEHT